MLKCAWPAFPASSGLSYLIRASHPSTLPTMTPSSRPLLLDLPSELIIKILQELSVDDLRRCIGTNNRVLASIIRGSSELQYGVAKQLAGLEDTPYAIKTYNLVDRAQHLSVFRRSWLDFDCTQVHTIPLSPGAETIYRLSSDILLMTETRPNSTSISHVPIVRPGLPDPVWERIEVNKPIINFATSIEAQDLLAVVTQYVLSTCFLSSLLIQCQVLPTQPIPPCYPSISSCWTSTPKHNTRWLWSPCCMCIIRGSGLPTKWRWKLRETIFFSVLYTDTGIAWTPSTFSTGEREFASWRSVLSRRLCFRFIVVLDGNRGP